MNKNTMDYNDPDEPYYGPFTVGGNIIYIDVAAPNIDNIYVTIEDLDTRKAIYDAQLAYGINDIVGSKNILLDNALLTYGIESSPGDKLLKILELALVHNKIVKVTKHIHEETIYIDHIALVRDLS
ncbi:hypothetical protein [Xenorhabdus siamensis]|uniref:hypothetical protein n=1 Tax=Xenorhabdus siamensis TaxID=3136254 RepID=UPI0030F3A92B